MDVRRADRAPRWRVHALGPLPGGAFAFGSGTSQAAAYAAGAAALARDAHPDWDAARAWSAVVGSGGALNVARAVG